MNHSDLHFTVDRGLSTVDQVLIAIHFMNYNDLHFPVDRGLSTVDQVLIAIHFMNYNDLHFPVDRGLSTVDCLYIYDLLHTTMSEISISTIDDITALNHLINSAYRGDSAKQGWTHEADLLTGIRTTEKELKDIIARENTFILKYLDGNIITACVLVEKKADKLYMGMLTVSPGLQGRGVGKKLLKATEETAIRLKCKKIEMTVIDARQELIAWYKRHGYEDTGERKPLPGEIQKAAIPGRSLEFIVMEKYV